MMREILFRGKQPNGKWEQGDLTQFCIDEELTTKISNHEVKATLNGLRVVTYTNEVIPETVGQYTGLTDKNGKAIFEGDIVKFCDIKGVINFGMGCYCVKTNKPDWKSRNNPAIDIVLNEYENELEIIGNIHDNPELLKEGANDDL